MNLTATTGANYDNDSEPDFLDEDDDNDGVADTDDLCATSATGWTSNATTDHDDDGCRDGFAEETDDDNDGVLNTADTVCPRGATGWTSNSMTDYDGDGCQDGTAEETDDDNDGVDNPADNCARGALGWAADPDTDFDTDGCRDRDEDAPVFEEDPYAFEFPSNRTGRINEVTVRNPATEFVLGGMTTNITIGARTGVLFADGTLTEGMYVLHVNASNSLGETRVNITLTVTDTPTIPPVFSRERTVIRLTPGGTYSGEPNLFFQEPNSFTVAAAEYGGEKVPGRGNFTGFDIFDFNSAGNFSINQPIDVSQARGLFLRISASNNAGESEAFVHILVTDPSNRTLYFASDGSVETIGKVHPLLPNDGSVNFNIASGNQTLFNINSTGALSVQETPQNRTHYLGIEEEHAGEIQSFANVTVFGRAPTGGNGTHYVYWLAENEWLKRDGSEQLPKIGAAVGDQLVFLCPIPMLKTAFPGPNIWYTQNRTVANNCRPERFAEPASAFFIGACDTDGKNINITVPWDVGNPDEGGRLEADNSYYFMSFSGGTEEQTTSREFKTGAACQAGMKFRLNVFPQPNPSP